jgi:hypothetical protein
MSTKLRSSTYLELWFGVLLLGTMLLLTGCSSNTFTPNLQVYVTTGNGVSGFAVPANSSGNVNVAPRRNPHRLKHWPR